ncbi:MAG TPA: hydrogenase iron-sulfur subunit [Dehalococcoidia bacterium]|jgi:F420-non-reducing hydrogenase iron-sulfur subunit|nr:hydrogenase iron-sulfur subunit [Dehalococcoidia bacterium]
MNDFTPKIIVFCCNWCSYAGADLAGTSRLKIKPYFRVIRTMCSGRIDPTFIFHAFAQGADGVMVAGCHPGDCHYSSGNYKARRRIMLLRNMLPQLGIESERLKLEWISASESPKFRSAVNGFIDEVTELGPFTPNGKGGAN